MLNEDEELSGLFGRLDVTEGETKILPLPLKGVHVKADIRDFIGEVIVSQCYQNNDTVNPVECIYHFPIDQAAAVCGLKVEYEDGTVVNGVVKEKREAAEQYRKAVKEGKQANLLQSVKRDIFTLNVGNLPPGGFVKIIITYITTLEARDDAAALVLPTSIAPRYVPSTFTDQVSSAEFAAAVQPTTTSVKLFGLDIYVNFTCKSTIKSISSPTHNEASYFSQGTKGSFNIHNIKLSRDLVVLCQEEKAHQPCVCVEIDDDGTMVGFVSIFPEIVFPDMVREFVFLLDRSGSMSAKTFSRVARMTQIDQAKEALLLFLRAIPPNSTFNVVSFGSHYETMFDSRQPYNDKTLDYASNKINSMQADLGGTEILKPLKFIFESTKKPATERQIFVLTDGEVYNDQAIFELIQNNCSLNTCSSRLFCIGVGANVSRNLCTGMARHGRGTVRFVEEGDPTSLSSKLMGQLKQALQPTLDQVTIEWTTPQINPPGDKGLIGYRSPAIGGKMAFNPEKHTSVRMFPSCIPPIFNKERFLSYSLFPCGCEVPKQVAVSCQTQDGPLKLVLEVRDQDIFHGSIAHKMAARAAISEFEDYQQSSNGKLISRSEALEMALKNNLGSALTSFLAVSEKPMVKSNSSAQRVEIPSADHKYQKIRRKQGALLLLRHASRCQHEAGKCPVTSHCESMKRVWDHIADCKNKACTVQHCQYSRNVLNHYQRCRDPQCQVCSPVRETIRRSTKGSSGRCSTNHQSFDNLPNSTTDHVVGAQPTSPLDSSIPSALDSSWQQRASESSAGVEMPQEPITTTAQIERELTDSSSLNSFNVKQPETHLASLNPNTQLATSDWKSKCLACLKALHTHQNGWVFNCPVDPVELSLPDYFVIIKNPMDLGTVQKRLETGVYHSIEEYGADVALTFDNAMTYNEKGSVVYDMAKELKAKFLIEYRKLLDQLDAKNDKYLTQDLTKDLDMANDFCSKEKDPEATMNEKDILDINSSTTISQLSPFDICILQKANGSFILSKKIAEYVCISEDVLNDIMHILESQKPFNNDINDQQLDNITFATILAIAAFRVLFAKEKSVWELHERKALAYLEVTAGSSHDIEKQISIVQSKLDGNNN